MSKQKQDNSVVLRQIAERAMADRGLAPQIPVSALAELPYLAIADEAIADDRRDQRHLLWMSIDNDDSRDLDQLTAAEALTGDRIKLFVAIADVDWLVKIGSAIDCHAEANTTSVYTPAFIFPMLPEPLSTDLTSLGEHLDRPAVVVEMVVDSKGLIIDSDIYTAQVKSQAKLAYKTTADWLTNKADPPPVASSVPGLAESLRLQDLAAQRLKAQRHERGALDLQIIHARPILNRNGTLTLAVEEKNRAQELIEDVMIAANSITAVFLRSRRIPSLRRVVSVPNRWERIVELAAGMGTALPETPDARGLAAFLALQRKNDPLRYPDLSLATVKLLGAGRYTVESPNDSPEGHFGLAVKNYTHSTAPNRRFPDLITQRLLKAALRDESTPYGVDELKRLALHCTQKEDDAEKVERLVQKAAIALLFATRIGERFEAIVTGAAQKGTWVRILNPPIEGKLVTGADGADVGDRLKVELVGTDVMLGHIDFRRVNC